MPRNEQGGLIDPFKLTLNDLSVEQLVALHSKYPRVIGRLIKGTISNAA